MSWFKRSCAFYNQDVTQDHPANACHYAEVTSNAIVEYFPMLITHCSDLQKIACVKYEFWMKFGIPYPHKTVTTSRYTFGNLASLCYRGSHDALDLRLLIHSIFVIRKEVCQFPYHSAFIRHELRQKCHLYCSGRLSVGKRLHKSSKAAKFLSITVTKVFIKPRLIWRGRWSTVFMFKGGYSWTFCSTDVTLF